MTQAPFYLLSHDREEVSLGRPLRSVSPGQSKRFTGKERDAETGLDYFGARYYGSRIGRFTTVDPSLDQKAAFVNPQKWNRYAYGLNNPLRYVDPDGRDVSVALSFTGTGWTAQDRSGVIGRVASWYSELGIGNAYVFDAAAMEHGAWFASLRTGYANVEVTSSSGTKHLTDKVFAGNFADLGPNQRLNAIANSVIHETAAHQFHATLEGMWDQVVYSRGAATSANPEVRRRRAPWPTRTFTEMTGHARTSPVAPFRSIRRIAARWSSGSDHPYGLNPQ
jgi:RHS repeat-associated protein